MLSIIVIGRNEAANLPRLHASLAPLLRAMPCETLYVDSASSDNSVEGARSLFDRTLVLRESPNLNASAGRYAGVLHARGDWALFLDGDMQLLEDCVPAICRHIDSADPRVGLVGPYVHHYVEGGDRAWVPPIGLDGRVLHFGGAVMLSMEALRKENWDPRLFSNEEAELYTRLRTHRYAVKRMDERFISHFTERLSFMERLRGNFICNGSYLGKKFYGVGQVLHARAVEGRLLSYMVWLPEPFVLWTAIAAAPLAGLAWAWPAALALPMLGATFVTIRRRSPRSVVTYLSFLPQALHGFRRLEVGWRPEVARTLYRTR